MTFWLDLACSWATPFFVPPAPASTESTEMDFRRRDAVVEGQLSAARFVDAAGACMDYQLFLPPHDASRKTLPLVVMLHGHSQELDAFITGTSMNAAAAAAGFAVL